ncbi:hypothetical protein BGZ63DRAFT_404347 [Mariannaea sp. PMI_226]|nr:hypothetical protein BGZ63DRAFT_404347 [Mariannaea sp. PMI_226]
MASKIGSRVGNLAPRIRLGSRCLYSCGTSQRLINTAQLPVRHFFSASRTRWSTSPTLQKTERPDFSEPKQARTLTPIILLTLIGIGGAAYYLSAPPPRPDTLNDQFFVPYTITARETISPSSFILTVIPDTPSPVHPYLRPVNPSAESSSPASWRWPLWSVEFKQPEVQIARHYTPLPPREGDDPADGTLRFYIRTVSDGEMSHYLARRKVGQDVHLRGPHAGFEIAERLGDKSRVVFLAGGTGIVPGMQAAKAVLESNPSATFDLLWAVRKREEIQSGVRRPKRSSWKFWEEKRPTELGRDIENPSPVAKHLSAMKAAYGDRLKIQVVVDQEHTKFEPKHIENLLLDNSTWPSPTIDPFTNGCRFHDQTMHIGATEFGAGTAEKGPKCICPSDMSKPGKNLFIVSGPDGFIQHYAGQKLWVGGGQTQGPVGGVIHQLQHQHPLLREDWLVLKM